MRVVLDTNVLVRAIGGANSPARALFLRLLERPHALVVSEFLLDELRRVIDYPRVQAIHGLSAEAAERNVNDIAAGAEFVDLPGPISFTVPQDPDDDPIVATAVYGRADVLCTRDQHLLRPDVSQYLEQFRVRVLTDIELLAELRKLDQETSPS